VKILTESLQISPPPYSSPLEGEDKGEGAVREEISFCKGSVLTWILAFILQSQLVFAGDLRIGTTYSPRQSEYLGLDWKQAYLAILDLRFDVIRLGTYWNEVEKTEGTYDFTVIDWQIFEARKRNIPVMLTVGMKAPRWPEYFFPTWMLKNMDQRFGDEIPGDDEYLKEKVLQFIRAVVSHYKDEKSIHYWQVENEPMDRAGAQYWWISKKFLKQEVDLVRQTDAGKRPIVINVATYPNKFLRGLSRFYAPYDPVQEAMALCDILGLNVYPAVGHKFWWRKMYFWSTPRERVEYFSEILARVKTQGKKAWIIEFQAEPWEPGLLVHKGDDRPPTGWPEMSRAYFKEFQSMGFDTFLLWGSEYWHFRKIQHKDDNWWNMVMDLFQAKKKQPAEEKH